MLFRSWRWSFRASPCSAEISKPDWAALKAVSYTHLDVYKRQAFANLGRNKKKTVLVVLSLALSVTLFNALCAFAGGFSVEKYLSLIHI